MPLLENAWYSLALEGAVNMAIIAEIADTTQWKAIQKILKTNVNASPYMEKYVLESFFKMKDPDGALSRMKHRYRDMVNSDLTTLWELWEHEKKGTGTNNHGWSGGPLTLLSQYVAGIAPESTAYETFHVFPQLGRLNAVQSKVITVKGDIELNIKRDNSSFLLEIKFPENTVGIIGIPKGKKPFEHIELNNRTIWTDDQSKRSKGVTYKGQNDEYYLFEAMPGDWTFKGVYAE